MPSTLVFLEGSPPELSDAQLAQDAGNYDETEVESGAVAGLVLFAFVVVIFATGVLHLVWKAHRHRAANQITAAEAEEPTQTGSESS